MSAQEIMLGAVAGFLVFLAASAFVELRLKAASDLVPESREGILRWRRIVRIAGFAWSALGFVAILAVTIAAERPPKALPDLNPPGRPGEPVMIGLFVVFVLLIAVKTGLGYWMSAIVAARFPGAPVLDTSERGNFAEKARKSREFDRWVAEVGAGQDAQLRTLHQADLVLSRVLWVLAATLAMVGAVVFWLS
jgi:hypothetical protein